MSWWSDMHTGSPFHTQNIRKLTWHTITVRLTKAESSELGAEESQIKWAGNRRRTKSSELGTEGEPNKVSWEQKESQIKWGGNRRKAKSCELGIEGKPNQVSWKQKESQIKSAGNRRATYICPVDVACWWGGGSAHGCQGNMTCTPDCIFLQK